MFRKIATVPLPNLSLQLYVYYDGKIVIDESATYVEVKIGGKSLGLRHIPTNRVTAWLHNGSHYEGFSIELEFAFDDATRTLTCKDPFARKTSGTIWA